ncbi:hypothetical protein TIFTF001_026774 [Ficus carica]|uniref:Uncharacterized protein n=1 Tax=Ficus carica TaxID=3494 RepID=A0AA88IZ52_FICCA|nr:hypothetical protein TIFTF001_026774 [Ficus carica]
MELYELIEGPDGNMAHLDPNSGESAKCFRYDLYQAFVRDHIDEETVWQRPAKVVPNYPTISQDDWERFITYRRTIDFKRLSQQGSEIRKKIKYGSTTGRDGYRKRDQEIFKQKGQYVAGYFIWRDTRLKPDGEYRNPSIKIIGETIAQYFNAVNILRENPEVSFMKRQLAALERTVQELCAKHGINRETMAEEATAPTVDQHKCFKASCTLNEKEADTSDLSPMPNASKECQLFLTDLINGGDVMVTIGRTYKDCVLTDTVHGIPLGTQIACPQQSVNGDDMPIYIGYEDVYHFITFKEISASSIMVYISYLSDCCAIVGMDQHFEFISSFLV